MDVGEYVTKLQEHLKQVHKSVERAQEEAQAEKEGRLEGHISHQLWPGDAVLVRREKTSARPVPLRFQPRCYPGVYRVKRKIDRHTFTVMDLADPRAELPFKQPINAERLVNLDMPELDLDGRQNRKLEIQESNDGPWTPFEIERFAVDGRVQIKRTDGVEDRRWCDLAQCRYRWIL